MNDVDNNRPAPAKPSSTIVVLRESDSQPELLMVKRRAGDAFGDSYAFPGGVVDHDESAAQPFCFGLSQEEANTILGVSQDGLDYYSAGIRELFEETGVLLARDGAGDWACDESLSGELRLKVDKGLLPWSQFLEQRSLHMACDSLHYFAHWETPMDLPKRWSTRFFAAKMPSGQNACHDGTETTDSRWMTVKDSLMEAARGDIRMPYPTIKTLEKMQHCTSIDELFDWIREQQSSGIGLNRLDSIQDAVS
jgi:8-oxo-dGTP pyrophosphatase MutT (NUDIX family)